MLILSESHHSPAASAGNDFSASDGRRSDEEFGRWPGLLVTVGKDEFPRQSLQDSDVSDGADASDRDAQEALSDIQRAAHEIARIDHYTGRTEPDVRA